MIAVDKVVLTKGIFDDSGGGVGNTVVSFSRQRVGIISSGLTGFGEGNSGTGVTGVLVTVGFVATGRIIIGFKVIVINRLA